MCLDSGSSSRAWALRLVGACDPTYGCGPAPVSDRLPPHNGDLIVVRRYHGEGSDHPGGPEVPAANMTGTMSANSERSEADRISKAGAHNRSVRASASS